MPNSESSEISEEDIELQSKRTEFIHEGYIEAADGILTESQVDQLSSYLKGLRDMLDENRLLSAQKEDEEEEQGDSGDRSE
jgi:hypothetical protein